MYTWARWQVRASEECIHVSSRGVGRRRSPRRRMRWHERGPPALLQHRRRREEADDTPPAVGVGGDGGGRIVPQLKGEEGACNVNGAQSSGSS